MDEDNKVESVESTENKHSPISCPHCKSTNLAFITEYHKSIGGRILFVLSLAVTVIIALFALQDFSRDSIGAIITFALPTIFIGIYITIVESKTNIQCICKDCGHDWLKK